MKHLLFLAALSAVAAPGPAQLNCKLAAKVELVPLGSDCELVLTVDVPTASKLDRTLLDGMQLVATIDGKKGPELGKKLSGTVDVAAGTTIVRRLKVPVAQVLPSADATGVTQVTFQWPGLPAASAAIKVVPDASKIDLDALDYTKTRVVLVTDRGDLTLSLFPDKAPNHVRNFVKLAREGFYDGTKFHRIMRDFMIQGGCPNTKDGATGAPGLGSSGETVNAEFNDTKHVRGILSAARGPDPNSHSCQFFICTGQAPWLDGQYSAFGKLEAGDDVLTEIANTPVGPDSRGEPSVPKVPVHLLRAIVLPVLKKQ